MADSWNSVQIATLAVNALTPIAVAGLGVFLARASHRLEQVQWANQTVVTRRLELFADIAPGLNKLLCFATFVGSWKELEPAAVIALKRRLDETMYANRVLFSEELFEAYREFMGTLFAMWTSTDADAPLRAPIESQWRSRRNMRWWNDSMTALFSTTDPSSTDDIQDAYERALGAVPRRAVRHPPEPAALYGRTLGHDLIRSPAARSAGQFHLVLERAELAADQIGRPAPGGSTGCRGAGISWTRARAVTATMGRSVYGWGCRCELPGWVAACTGGGAGPGERAWVNSAARLPGVR